MRVTREKNIIEKSRSLCRPVKFQVKISFTVRVIYYIVHVSLVILFQAIRQYRCVKE